MLHKTSLNPKLIFIPSLFRTAVLTQANIPEDEYGRIHLSLARDIDAIEGILSKDDLFVFLDIQESFANIKGIMDSPFAGLPLYYDAKAYYAKYPEESEKYLKAREVAVRTGKGNIPGRFTIGDITRITGANYDRERNILYVGIQYEGEEDLEMNLDNHIYQDKLGLLLDAMSRRCSFSEITLTPFFKEWLHHRDDISDVYQMQLDSVGKDYQS